MSRLPVIGWRTVHDFRASLGSRKPLRLHMMLWRISVALGLVALVAGSTVAEAGSDVRHAGRLHSLVPGARVMIIEEVRSNGLTRLIEIDIDGAEVVRVWRNASEPWRWSERPTSIQRWAAGTLVIVIGRTDRTGTIHATRVELPRIEAR